MDDRKLNELLNKALASLTEEQKEKAKACRTAKELLDLLAEAGVELPDDALDKVAGGVESDVQDGNNPGSNTPTVVDNILENIIGKINRLMEKPFHMQ